MEQVRDLNMDADDMLVVLSAVEGVNRRIKEVAQTHKPLFGGEHFLTGKEVCERLYISSHLARLSGQENYSLHTICREDSLQGFGFGEDVGR